MQKLTTIDSKKIYLKVNKHVHLFLFLLLSFFVKGQNHPASIPEKALINAYENVLKLKLDDGRSALIQFSKTNQETAFSRYIEDLADVINLLLNENETLYRANLKKARESIQFLNTLPSTDPYKRFVIAEIKLRWAFVKIKFGDSFSAGWDIKQANKLISENHALFPEFIPNLKSGATLNLLIGSVPTKYNWLLSLFGLKGNISEGLNQLKQLEQKRHFLSLEAAMIRRLSGVYIFQDKELINSFENIYQNHSDNLLVKFSYAAACFKSHKSENALKIINEAQNMSEDYASIHYLDYMKGKIMLQKKNYSLAIFYFRKFLKLYSGENNIKDAHFQIFLGFWLSDHVQKANLSFELAKNQGAAISSADKYANEILSHKGYPNKEIMQLRLATDGGYFDLASQDIALMKEENLTTTKSKSEFVYRKARYFHLTQKIEQAIKYYQLTVEDSKSNNWYFAPSSSFQLGNIYMEKKDYLQAKSYFERVITFKNYPYKLSLDQQANALLSKIESITDQK